MSATDRIWYQGKELDELTLQIVRTADKLLRLPKFGAEREAMTILQGSFRPYTSYSGPTHRGGGVIDITAWNWRNRIVVFDLLGMVFFHRTPAQGNWAEHCHGVVDGLGTVDPYARGQITSAKNGRNGLANNGPDPDKALRSGLWPLAVYAGRTGVIRATASTRLYDGPSSSRKVLCDVPAGTPTTALMEVRNAAGNKWFVDNRGCWGYAAKWEAA